MAFLDGARHALSFAACDGILRADGWAMDQQFLVDRCKWELDRKDKISSTVNFPTTILILVSGLLGALLPKLQLTAQAIVIPVVGAFLVAGAWGCFAMWCFVHAYRGSRYVYLPLVRDLETTRLQLQAQEDPDDEPGGDFAAQLRERIIDATDANTSVNDRRQAFLERGSIALVWMFIATASCATAAYLSVIFKAS